jgi:uncharacterized protein YcbK (DUF882 family)
VRLTRNFDSAEFRSKDGARMPRGYLRELRQLCVEYLQPLRDEFGTTIVSSGHRSATHNANVGGAPASRHLDLPGLKGAAADVSCARGTPRDWYQFLDSLDPGGLGLYSTHVHVDNRSGRARW